MDSTPLPRRTYMTTTNTKKTTAPKPPITPAIRPTLTELEDDFSSFSIGGASTTTTVTLAPRTSIVTVTLFFVAAS